MSGRLVGLGIKLIYRAYAACRAHSPEHVIVSMVHGAYTDVHITVFYYV